MSVVSVSNVHLNTAGSTRMETVDSGGNVRIVIESANVMYANPTRIVFPTGSINVNNDLAVSGRAYLAGANASGDLAVVGNVYVAGATSPLVPGSIAITLGSPSSNPTATDIPSGKYLKITGWGVIPADGSGGQPRMYISSDNGANYSNPHYLTPDSSGNNIVNFVVFISNTSIAGTSKEIKVIGRSMDAFTSTSIPYAISSSNTYTESSVTGIINSIKTNCSSGLSLTNGALMVESIN